MIKPLLIYSAVTVLLALVDHLRRAKEMGKKENIDHKLSFWLGAIGWGLTTVFALGRQDELWKYIVMPLVFGVGCIGVRYLVYDPLLNIFNRERFDHVSTTTSSYKDQHTNHLPFWGARAIGAGLIGISLLVNYWIR